LRRSRGRQSYMIYVDVNVLYYYLTAHEEFGARSKELLEEYSDYLATSALTAWLLYVLTRLENVAEILSELGIRLLPLTSEVLRLAIKMKIPKDFEDRIHLATMKQYNIEIILSNDRDFDLPNVKRIF